MNPKSHKSRVMTFCSCSNNAMKLAPRKELTLIMSDIYRCGASGHYTIICKYCNMHYGTYKLAESLGFMAFYHNAVKRTYY